MLSVCNFVGGQTVTYLPYPDEKPYLGVFSEVITPIKKEDVYDLNFEVFHLISVEANIKNNY